MSDEIMKSANDCKRRYYFDTTNEIVFGLFDNEWGTCGCARMRWGEWQIPTTSIPQIPEIKIYNDSWSVLTKLRDIFDALAELDSDRITPKRFCELLESHNFELDPEQEPQS